MEAMEVGIVARYAYIGQGVVEVAGRVDVETDVRLPNRLTAVTNRGNRGPQNSSQNRNLRRPTCSVRCRL